MRILPILYYFFFLSLSWLMLTLLFRLGVLSDSLCLHTYLAFSAWFSVGAFFLIVPLSPLFFCTLAGEVNWGSVWYPSGLRDPTASAQNMPGASVPDQTSLAPPEDPRNRSGQVRPMEYRNYSHVLGHSWAPEPWHTGGLLQCCWGLLFNWKKIC